MICHSPCSWGSIQGKRKRKHQEKKAKNREEILAPLESVWLPKEDGYLFLRIPKRGFPRSQKQLGYQGNSPKINGASQSLGSPSRSQLMDHQEYSQRENDWAKKELATQTNKDGGCYQSQTILCTSLGRWLVTDVHTTTHLEAMKTAELLRPRYYLSNLGSLVKDITFRHATCAQINPRVGLEEMGLGTWSWAYRNQVDLVDGWNPTPPKQAMPFHK